MTSKSRFDTTMSVNEKIRSSLPSNIFSHSLKNIALYNLGFSFLAFIIVMSVLNGTKGNNNSSYYSESDTNNSVVTTIYIFTLLFSNIGLLLSNYIAKKSLLSPFNEIMATLSGFVLGFLIGFYSGRAIGRSMFMKKKGKVNKDEAAMRAFISATKKKDITYNSKEMKLKENIEYAGSSISNMFHSLLGKLEKKNINPNNFTYSYGISFWFYVDTQPPSTSVAYSKYTNILNYGGKPQITYKGDENKVKITFKMNDYSTKDILFYDKLKYQKWNHFIVNYDHGTVDVFINNELVATEKEIAPYMVHDHVIVGENKGINGGIKDIQYYPHPIKLNTIKNLFRTY